MKFSTASESAVLDDFKLWREEDLRESYTAVESVASDNCDLLRNCKGRKLDVAIESASGQSGNGDRQRACLELYAVGKHFVFKCRHGIREGNGFERCAASKSSVTHGLERI